MDASALTRPPGVGVGWLPAGAGALGVVDGGVHWDAVRAPDALAVPALAALARDGVPGAVLADPISRTTYWLVPVGYAGSVATGLPAAVLPLGTGSHIVMATARTVDGHRPHWIRPPEPGQWVTDPAVLRAALAAAAGITLPPLRDLPALGRVTPEQVAGQRCVWCTQPIAGPAVPYPRLPRRTSGWAARWWYPRAHTHCAATR